MRFLPLVIFVPLALSVFFGLAPQGAAAPPALAAIQPGGPLTEGFLPGNVPQALCTNGFILRDGAGTWYSLTAGHCVTLDQQVYLTAAGGYYGKVVADDDYPAQGGPAAGIDVALVRIFATKTGYISPAVRGYGGPTGIATSASAVSGDPILLTGYITGNGYGEPLNVNQLQYAQHGGGIFTQWDGPLYRSIDSSVDGYSGGPVIMDDDGEALGLVSATVAHFQVGLPSADAGPSVSSALARLSSVYGFSGLVLQTAPFTGAPPL